MKQRAALLAAALWWGSLTAIGFLVVPMLFAHLATPAMAGQMAARLFTAQSWVSVGCVLVLLLATTRRDAGPGASAPPGLMFLLAGLLLALLLEYGVAPRIVARENLRLWHGVGSGMYLLQWLCAGAFLWRLGRPRG
ncbi:DUF4149 domain-containing protein [Xenophilus sp.]|uniref:DUF4149 domain-containing protein n=1 Tax=Xenophilus sp. TaxID=1873499 RepID=UPI0037DCA7C3